MAALRLILFLLFVPFLLIGQRITVDRVNVRENITLKGMQVDSISKDKLFGSPTHSEVPTQKAVFDFVSAQIAAINLSNYARSSSTDGLFVTGNVPIAVVDGKLGQDNNLNFASNVFNSPAFSVNGSSGGGFIGFAAQGSAPATPGSGFRIFANSAGNMGVVRPDGYVTTFDFSAATGNRFFTYPANAGTFGILENAQSWTGVNTFNNTVFGNGSAHYTDANTPSHATNTGSLAWKVSGINQYVAAFVNDHGSAGDGIYIKGRADKSSTGKLVMVENNDGTFVAEINGAGHVWAGTQLRVGTSSPSTLNNTTLTLNSSSTIDHGASVGLRFSPFGTTNAVTIRQTTGNLLVGTTTDIATAILNLSSTSKFAINAPIMTDAQAAAITGQTAGGWVYSTTQQRPFVHNGTAFQGVVLGPQAGFAAGQITYGGTGGNLTSTSDFNYTSGIFYTRNPSGGVAAQFISSATNLGLQIDFNDGTNKPSISGFGSLAYLKISPSSVVIPNSLVFGADNNQPGSISQASPTITGMSVVSSITLSSSGNGRTITFNHTSSNVDGNTRAFVFNAEGAMSSNVPFFQVRRAGTDLLKVSSAGVLTVKVSSIVSDDFGPVTFGRSITTGSNSGVAIGHNTTISNNGSSPSPIAIGQSATTGTQADAIAIGLSANASSGGVAFGRGAISSTGVFVLGGASIGGSDLQVDVLQFGTTPTSGTYNVKHRTLGVSSAFGTNQQGSNLTISSGPGTGTGTTSDLIFRTPSTGTTGTTIQTLADRWFIKGATGTLSNISSPNASAIVDFSSTVQGFLIPRGTDANIAAISSPALALQMFSTTSERINVKRTSGFFQVAYTQDILRDSTYKTVNANLDLSGLTTTFKTRFHTVRIKTVVTASASGNNTITMPPPSADLLGISFKVSVEDTSGDGDISVLAFGTDGSDGYLYNGDGTFGSTMNLFPGLGVYLSVAWCEVKSAYRWELQ